MRVGLIVRNLALAVAASASLASFPSAGSRDSSLAIARAGFRFYGGTETERPGTGINGDIPNTIRTGQIAVLSLQPATRRPKAPVVLLPGYGIAADTYLETSDGREGWAMAFVRAGHPTHIVEPSHSSRSGLDSGFALRTVPGGAKALFSWGKNDVWRRWGLGTEPGVPFVDGRFPKGQFDRVVAAFTAIEAEKLDGGSQIGFQVADNVRGLTELLNDIGPAFVVLHSASGVSGFALAKAHPKLVRGMVVVEPVGCPAAPPPGVPLLAMFGDHMEVRPQMPARQAECDASVAALKAAGTRAEMYALPAMGIRGNSHLMMMENNSDALAGMILRWIDAARGGKR